MSLSIVVCTYNRCGSLRETLAALGRQTVSEGVRLDILVVDNNSTDGTRAVVEAAARSLPWPVRYLFEGQQGLSYARNRGIRESNGELIFFTDDDVLPEPSWVQALHDACVTYHADCMGGKILPLWLGPRPAWTEHPSLQTPLWALLALLDQGDQMLVAEKAYGNFLYGANLGFRRSALLELGFFRTDLGVRGSKKYVGEETEMLERFARAGKRIVYTPQAVVHHKVPPERLRMAYLRAWRFQWGKMTASRFGVAPRHPSGWLVRECAENGLGALWAYGRRRTAEAIQRELQFWTQLGQIIGAFRA